ncbi:hypothetical protein JOY44_10370 [Phormidium sp. CLA17]|uniref:hypothetical protein n=1 Tax=Leptolyngbya sp. Cla-17 TaxID=2803751 RepID=UPI001492EAF4|nr:hypothetical protein [Leptolyngbya sp. Cla-17]MBM0742018.1 hypothetical protein [Leptolyngbya sp. Cla-17]
MTTLMTEKITADLQKAKAEGGLRVEKIREIFKNAVAQSIAEVKGGSGEVRTIAKDSIASVIDILNKTGNNTQADVNASVEGIVEGIQDSNHSAADIGGALAEIEASGNQTSADMQSLMAAVLNAVKRTQQYALFMERYAEVKIRLNSVDAQLSKKYGDRYQQLKQQLERFWDLAKVWFGKAKATVSAPDPIQRMQVELGAKMAEKSEK